MTIMPFWAIIFFKRATTSGTEPGAWVGRLCSLPPATSPR